MPNSKDNLDKIKISLNNEKKERIIKNNELKKEFYKEKSDRIEDDSEIKINIANMKEEQNNIHIKVDKLEDKVDNFEKKIMSKNFSDETISDKNFDIVTFISTAQNTNNGINSIQDNLNQIKSNINGSQGNVSNEKIDENNFLKKIDE